MKPLLFLLFTLLTLLPLQAQSDTTRILITTTAGPITAILFNDTPLHRDNFIRNIRGPELEAHFFRVLHRLSLPVKVESNQR